MTGGTVVGGSCSGGGTSEGGDWNGRVIDVRVDRFRWNWNIHGFSLLVGLLAFFRLAPVTDDSIQSQRCRGLWAYRLTRLTCPLLRYALKRRHPLLKTFEL